MIYRHEIESKRLIGQVNSIYKSELKNPMYFYAMELLTDISGSLLLQVKQQQPTASLQRKLSEFSYEALRRQLNNDNVKKCFWINIYNAFYQILARNHNKSLGNIYHRKEISIAHKRFSLDDVEHGILRKYRWKWAKGYLPNPFISSTLRQLAVKKMDCRIHFALNCGAVSCPPIAFYKAQTIDQQLQLAMESFLESETSVFIEERRVETSKLLQWFAGDFGGEKGTLRILSEALEKDVRGYTLTFTSYNWEKQLDNFS